MRIVSKISKRKSNLHFTRGITLQSEPDGETHIRGLAPEQHRNVASVASSLATVSALAGPGIELKVAMS